MRIAFVSLTACTALLSACGGPQTSQANNSSANISNDSRDANQATANLEARVSLGDATKIMHARHEGMETIGKDFKALHREFDSPTPNLALVRTAAGQISGLAVLATDPKEITVVNIVGPVDLEKLSELEGNFGVPVLGIDYPKAKPKN